MEEFADTMVVSGCAACTLVQLWAPKYAGFPVRLAAYLLDGLFAFVVSALLAIPVSALLDLPSDGGLPTDPKKGFFIMNLFLGVGILTKVAAWLYFTLFESSSWRATPGKRILGLQVTDTEGRRISFGRANKRYFSKLLSDILYLGYLPIIISDRHQGLHDRIADTVVLHK